MLGRLPKNTLRNALLAGAGLLAVCGLAWFFFAGGDESGSVEQGISSPEGRDEAGVGSFVEGGFAAEVQAGLAVYAECLEGLYRENLRRQADFDHGAAAWKYVEQWSRVIRSLPVEGQLAAITRELVNYGCDPL